MTIVIVERRPDGRLCEFRVYNQAEDWSDEGAAAWLSRQTDAGEYVRTYTE